MHAIEAILGRPEVERLGWVLLHFVSHIIAAIAGIVVLVLAVLAVVWALRVIL